MNNLTVAANTHKPTITPENNATASLSEVNSVEMKLAALLMRDPDVTPLSSEAGMPVDAFDFDLLPDTLKKWAKDIQKRLQCPPDFIAVSIMIGLAAVAGNKYKIRPKSVDHTWSVVPNLWGLLIGSPSSKKTPALNAGLEHIYSLDKSAREKGKRIVVNDSTIEKVQILQAENPAGLLLVNDEISGMFKGFESQSRSGDRPYLLQAFNGDKPYSVDRVGRDSVYIPQNTLSLIGNIQPDVLKCCFSGNLNTGDGFLQRLQLAVFPDFKPSFKLVDCAPDEFAHEDAKETFTSIYNGVGKNLNFALKHQHIFNDWYERNAKLAVEFENQGRNDLASHLQKFPALVASLALLIELADNQHITEVGEQSLNKAIGWSNYLFSHAKRIYGYGDEGYKAANLLLEKRQKLEEDFSPSQVKQKGWKGLNDLNFINAAIDVLVAHNYLMREEKSAKETGGKPSLRYRWNNTL
ncbi:DUF3987 domain-containing protein [Phaeobacter sp. SYSU ZJ3003]|uniref:DUF3987 domain-containing protein n=1 Tax=Phaeobacter sp. SYSU ZJ3003 TaxID=2109330 RepID=UPI00351BFC2F